MEGVDAKFYQFVTVTPYPFRCYVRRNKSDICQDFVDIRDLYSDRISQQQFYLWFEYMFSWQHRFERA